MLSVFDLKFLRKDVDCRYANKTLGVHGDIYLDGQDSILKELVKEAEGDSHSG